MEVVPHCGRSYVTRIEFGKEHPQEFVVRVGDSLGVYVCQEFIQLCRPFFVYSAGVDKGMDGQPFDRWPPRIIVDNFD